MFAVFPGYLSGVAVRTQYRILDIDDTQDHTLMTDHQEWEQGDAGHL